MLTYDLTARGRKTMYEYLYEAMKADILSGRLTAGEKLPSKRAFAEHLQVSVKTVENTYEQLLLEGYIRSEEKRGYFVNRLEVKNVSAPAYASFVTRFREEEYLADLTANNIQYDKFPFATWAKIMRQTLTDYDTSLLKTVPFNGVEKLILCHRIILLWEREQNISTVVCYSYWAKMQNSVWKILGIARLRNCMMWAV